MKHTVTLLLSLLFFSTVYASEITTTKDLTSQEKRFLETWGSYENYYEYCNALLDSDDIEDIVNNADDGLIHFYVYLDENLTATINKEDLTLDNFPLPIYEKVIRLEDFIEHDIDLYCYEELSDDEDEELFDDEVAGG